MEQCVRKMTCIRKMKPTSHAEAATATCLSLYSFVHLEQL